MQYRPRPNCFSIFTTTKNKQFTGNGPMAQVQTKGREKVVCLLFSQLGSFFDDFKLLFLLDKL
jgi:hypothetical protein